MTKEQLLAEVEDLLRTATPREKIYVSLTEEDVAWLGRASAVIENWSEAKAITLQHVLLPMIHGDMMTRPEGYDRLMTLLHQARHDLRMQTLGPMNVALPQGMVFDYFDEIRKIIEVARQDLLFVDPYLDAEFVSRYLSHTTPGVTTRLLAREKLATLLPAVDAFTKQTGMKLEVRSAPGFHDRYIFVDKTTCYQSGASFKDGAKSSPTTLTQITDAFTAVLQTYETLWTGARVER
jgi:hypothetical protein